MDNLQFNGFKEVENVINRGEVLMKVAWTDPEVNSAHAFLNTIDTTIVYLVLRNTERRLHSELPQPIFQIRPRMYIRRTIMYEIAAFCSPEEHA